MSAVAYILLGRTLALGAVRVVATRNEGESKVKDKFFFLLN